MRREKERRSRVTLSVPFVSRDFESTACRLHVGRKFAIFFLVRPLTEKAEEEECRSSESWETLPIFERERKKDLGKHYAI